MITFSLLSLANVLSAQTVVVPNAFESVEAPFGNAIPFGTNIFCDNGIRYQQVYADAEIARTGTITAVRFRLDRDTSNPFSSVYGGTTVSISTAATGLANLSNVFADNVGTDVVEVFSGELTLSSAGGSDAPKPFDIEINLEPPFTYSGGDLLLDISIQVCANPSVFFDRPDGVDVSATRRIAASDVSASSGTIIGSGIVTQFQFSDFPDGVFNDRFEAN